VREKRAEQTKESRSGGTKKTRIQYREYQRGLKEKRGKKGKKTIPGRCREGGNTAGTSERREHSSRRETEKRAFEWGAAEEKQRRERLNGGQQKRERKCSGRGLGFSSRQHSRFFFF